MTAYTKKKPLRLLLIIFLIINVLVFALRKNLAGWQIDTWIVFLGNLILFLASVLSFLLVRKGLNQGSTHGFIRMVYSGILLKIGICIAATLVYALAKTGQVNKGAILLSFGFYFLYSFAEVKLLTGLSKLEKNA